MSIVVQLLLLSNSLFLCTYGQEKEKQDGRRGGGEGDEEKIRKVLCFFF